MIHWLIKYCPGARGDFLGNVLCSDIVALNTYYKLPFQPKDTIKIHTLQSGIFNAPALDKYFKNIDSYDKLFEVCQVRNIKTIRITNNSVEEKLDACYLHYAKNNSTESPNTIRFEDAKPHDDVVAKFFMDTSPLTRLHGISTVFNDDINYLARYDDVVEFKDLFDVEFVADFYHKQHGSRPSAALVEAIRFNIENNTRLTETSFWALNKDRARYQIKT